MLLWSYQCYTPADRKGCSNHLTCAGQISFSGCEDKSWGVRIFRKILQVCLLFHVRCKGGIPSGFLHFSCREKGYLICRAAPTTDEFARLTPVLRELSGIFFI